MTTKNNSKKPDCAVCGQPSTGFHYGATSCEACKVFFRRSVGKNLPTSPLCTGDCTPIVHPDTGRVTFICPLCRFNKCVQAGMKKQEGKRGRYSHEQKAESINRMKQNLQDDDKVSSTSSTETQPVTVTGTNPTTRGSPRFGAGKESTNSQFSYHIDTSVQNSMETAMTPASSYSSSDELSLIQMNENGPDLLQEALEYCLSQSAMDSPQTHGLGDITSSSTTCSVTVEDSDLIGHIAEDSRGSVDDGFSISDKYSCFDKTVDRCLDLITIQFPSQNNRNISATSPLGSNAQVYRGNETSSKKLLQNDQAVPNVSKEHVLQYNNSGQELNVLMASTEPSGIIPDVPHSSFSEAAVESVQSSTVPAAILEPEHPNDIDVLGGEDIEDIVQRLLDVHRQYDEVTEETYLLKEQAEHQYLQERKLLEEMFGKMEPLSKEEHLKIYHETGIDIDGRVEELKEVGEYTEYRLRAQMAFLKAMPKFGNLLTKDKYAILKGSKNDEFAFTFCRLLNTKEEIGFYPPLKKVYGAEIDMKIIGETYYARMGFILLKRLKEMELTDEELILLKAICYYCPDRCLTPEGAEVVDSVQLQLADHLQKVIETNHPGEPLLFAKALVFLADLRIYSSVVDYYTLQTLISYQHDLELPNHVVEYYSPSGMAYEPALPRDDVAPPPAKVRQYLLGYMDE